MHHHLPAESEPRSADAPTLTIAAAARWLGIHPNTLRAWADDGRVSCSRVGARGDRRFRLADLRAFLRSSEKRARPTGDPRGRRADRPSVERMAAWEAQIESIAKLGSRLNRLTSVADIGTAICVELRQLIEYHNVRVYRVVAEEVVPVAWRGEIGEYFDEESDQLRLKVGEGITGWVAQYGRATYLPDAARDPRAATIPGTESDLDESMLLAPMLYEDRAIGVIVLSKLGLDRFTADDLRYLGIYASIATQAMVNADASERIRAQERALDHELESQRELLRVTESILSNLDPAAVVEEIADRLGALIPVDDLVIDVHDVETGCLRPLLARGVHATRLMARTLPDDTGVAGWVLRKGEARLSQQDLPEPAALILAPLRARDRVLGVLTLSRLGSEARFEGKEFDLIKLFAAHVSIAMQNALAHHAVELRAQTDALTGLKNHGRLQEELAAAVNRSDVFSLLMLDLDDFKMFNDQRGHEAGNELLRSIARALKAACREVDEVYRYGGDEFALILRGTRGSDAGEVAARVRRAIWDSPEPDTHRRSRMRCSIGVATCPDDASEQGALLLAADRACYAAKRAGGDRVATALEGRALAPDFQPSLTPVDEPGQVRTVA